MIATPVKFSTSFDVEQTKAFEVGAAFELECEVTEPTAEVCWYKDGCQLRPQNGWDINSDGSFRRLIVQSAELFHSGRYSCETSDDTIQFTVAVKGDFYSFWLNLESCSMLVLVGDLMYYL